MATLQNIPKHHQSNSKARSQGQTKTRLQKAYRYSHLCVSHQLGRALIKSRLFRQSLAAANDVCVVSDVQAIFFRRRHQPRRPPLAKIRPGSPAPATGPGTGAIGIPATVTPSNARPESKSVSRKLVTPNAS